MAKKCYVVYASKVPSVYKEWEDCQKQVNEFSGNSYKGYKTREVVEDKWMKHGRKKWRNFVVITTLLFIVVGCVLYFTELARELCRACSCNAIVNLYSIGPPRDVLGVVCVMYALVS